MLFPLILFQISLFVLYLVAHQLGKDIFLPLAVGAGIASLGVIAYSAINPSTVSGGFVFEHNYDILAGYVLLGSALFLHRYQWLLSALALIAIFLSGSPEGLFAVGVLAIVVLLRRDWSVKLGIVAGSLAIIALLYFGLGYGQRLYNYTMQVATDEPTVSSADTSALGYRLLVIKESMQSISLLGDGYNLTNFGKEANVHNVPLVIVQQLGWPGVLAGLAWLWVTIWCLVKTRLKYVWALVLALSVFDHFIWTQLAPWWWAIAGVATSGSIKSDYIFRKE